MDLEALAGKRRFGPIRRLHQVHGPKLFAMLQKLGETVQLVCQLAVRREKQACYATTQEE